MNIMVYALELQIRFIVERRTEPYQEYGKGVVETKIGYGAKNTSGADSSAGWQACAVRKP